MSQIVSIPVRVVYPAKAGRIVLRTDEDWSRDVEPAEISGDGTRCDFKLRTERSFMYFKPVLRAADEARWSAGQNYLALADAPQRLDIYPSFDATSNCTVSDVHEITDEAGMTLRYRVFCPPGYGENTIKRYPVLYMQDGQNVFFAEEAYTGEHWRVPETLGILSAMNVLNKVIVVGLYPQDRERDYTLPGYEAYGRCVVETLKPAVDEAFRTLDGPNETAVMGSSLGGVASFHLAWQWPEVFGRAACLSSSFGFRDDLRERVLDEKPKPIRLYLDSGWPEDNYEVTRDMHALLVDRGYREGLDLLYFAFPLSLHNEHDWALRSHIPFQYFFGKDRRHREFGADRMHWGFDAV